MSSSIPDRHEHPTPRFKALQPASRQGSPSASASVFTQVDNYRPEQKPVMVNQSGNPPITNGRAQEQQRVADPFVHTPAIFGLNEVSAFLGLSPNSILKNLKAGKFPQPVVVGEPGCYAAGWLLEDLIAYATTHIDSFPGHESETERPERLNAAFVRDIQEPGRYGNGRGGFGLSLLVEPTKIEGLTSKTWSQRVCINGKETNLGLGSYPDVTLEEALQRAKRNRQAIKEGRDPRLKATLTFREAETKMLERRVKGLDPGSNSPAEWAASFALHVDPLIGEKDIKKVSRHDIMACLEPLWFDRRVTATKLLKRIQKVMRWAIAHEYIDDDPTEHVAEGLGPNPSRPNHRDYLHPDEVGPAIKVIEKSSSGWAVKGAMRLLIATGVRSKEVRGAMWHEFDFCRGTWTIPGSRRKKREDFTIPVSWAAFVVLNEVLQRTDGVGLVFPSPKGKGKMLSGQALRNVLRANGIDSTVHGFRTSQNTFAKEEMYSDEIAEAALGHALPPHLKAYLREHPPELRRPLMDAWATRAGFFSPPIFTPLPSPLPTHTATNPPYRGGQLRIPIAQARRVSFDQPCHRDREPFGSESEGKVS